MLPQSLQPIYFLNRQAASSLSSFTFASPATLCESYACLLITVENMDFATSIQLSAPEIDQRPPPRVYVPYFIFLPTANLFFCFVLLTQLLKNANFAYR
jgi:hypothetical protein